MSFGLQEAIENLAAMRVERVAIADEKVDAVAVGDEQTLDTQAPDVLFALEDELRVAVVRDDLPLSRRTALLGKIVCLKRQIIVRGCRVGRGEVVAEVIAI